MVSKYRGCEKEKRQMEGVYRLYQSKSSMLERPFSYAED